MKNIKGAFERSPFLFIYNVNNIRNHKFVAQT